MPALLDAPVLSVAGSAVSCELPVVATFDEIIVGAWEGLASAGTVTCPACGGAMAPRRSTDGPGGALRTFGACGSCHAELS